MRGHSVYNFLFEGGNISGLRDCSLYRGRTLGLCNCSLLLLVYFFLLAPREIVRLRHWCMRFALSESYHGLFRGVLLSSIRSWWARIAVCSGSWVYRVCMVSCRGRLSPFFCPSSLFDTVLTLLPAEYTAFSNWVTAVPWTFCRSWSDPLSIWCSSHGGVLSFSASFCQRFSLAGAGPSYVTAAGSLGASHGQSVIKRYL